MHEHKASGFILTLNEKLTNYSSNLINMQTDICYLGVNSRGIFVGGGALTHRPLVPSAAGEPPHLPGPGASPLSDPHPHPRGEGVGDLLEMETDSAGRRKVGGGCTV